MRTACGLATAILLGLGAFACGPRSGSTTAPGAASDRDLRVVIPPRWEVAQVVSTPMEALGFRAGPELARSVHQTGLGELVLRDVRADRHLATLTTDTYEPEIVELSADATRLAFELHDGTLELWDAEHGRRIASLGRPPRLDTLWFSGDGSILVGAGEDGSCRIWDGRTGELRHLLRDLGPKAAARPSPDGRRVVTTGSRTVLWNAVDGRPIATIHPERRQGIDQILFSPDARRFVALDEHGGAGLWNAEDGQPGVVLAPPRPTRPDRDPYLRHVSWSPRGGVVALSWADPETFTAYATDGRLLWSTPADVRTVAFSTAEDSVVVTTWGAFTWASLRSGETLAEGIGDVVGAVFRPGVDGPTLVHRRRGELVTQGRPVGRLAVEDLTTLRTSDDGRWVVLNERSETLGRSYGDPGLLDARTLAPVSPTTGHAIDGARYLPKGDAIVSGGHRVNTWDAQTLVPRATCPHVPELGSGMLKIAVLEDGAAVAALGDGVLALFELDDSSCRLRKRYTSLLAPRTMLSAVRPSAGRLPLLQTDEKTYEYALLGTDVDGPVRPVEDELFDTLLVDPSGSWLVAGSYDGSVRAIDRSGVPWRFGPVSEEDHDQLTGVAFDPQSDRIVAMDTAGRVRLFEPGAGRHRVVRRLELGQERWGVHYDMAFADADTVLVLREDVLHVVSIDAGPSGEVQVLTGVQGFALHPDGEQLVLAISGGCDPTVYGRCRGRAVVRFVTLDGLVERSSVPVRGPGVARFDFAPDARALVATGVGAMQLLRAPAGRSGATAASSP